MSRVSVLNSFTTRNLLTGWILEGEYDSVIDVAEININLTGSLLVPADGMTMEYHYSNDGVNVAEIVTAPLIITESHFQKLQSEYNFFKIKLTVNTDVSLCSLSTIFKTMPCFEEIQNTRIRATNGDALTASNGALNVNLSVGEEIIVSGEVEVSNFPDIQKISATDGTALTVSDGGLNVNILNGETIVVSGDVIVQGIEPQFCFYATPLTNTSAVYADGAPGTNANGGWLYVNNGASSGLNKINWYCYSNTADQAATAKKVSSIVSMYAVIYQKTLTVAPVDSKNPHFVFYTLPEAANNTSWYKNRYVFTAYSDRSSVVGLKLLYIGVDNPLIHPEITTRIQLIIDPVTSTNTLAGGANEDLWLGSIQTSSSNASGVMPAGQYNFVFSEYGINFTEEARLPTVLPIIDNKVQVSLATNAATESTLSLINGKTPALGQQLAAASQPVVLTLAQVDLIKPLATQPISGSVGISTSVLPTGAASEATLLAINTKTPSLGQKASLDDCQPVVLTTAQVDLIKPLATQPISGSVGISTSVLPTGASSEATLLAINEKIPTIGQKTIALSSPVCLPSEQMLVDQTVNELPINVMIQGGWYKVMTLGNTTQAQWNTAGAVYSSEYGFPPIGRVFKCSIAPGYSGVGIGTVSMIVYRTEVTLGVGTNNVGQFTAQNTLYNTNPVTQCVVGQWYTAGVKGTTTDAEWTILTGKNHVQYYIFKCLSITGVTGTGAATKLLYNEDVVVKSSALPTGACTETTLLAINTKTPSLGQKASSDDCQPVVLTTAQIDLLKPLATQPISGNIGITGNVSLPTGASTEATLLAINTKIPNLGLQAVADSQPVCLSTAQIDLIKPLATQPISGNVGITGLVSLPTNASTETTLVAMNDKIPTIGQKTTALSAPVCLPAEQLTAMSSQLVDPAVNTRYATQAIVGNWYKVVSLGTTPASQWDTAGAVLAQDGGFPPIGRVFKCMGYVTGGTGTVSTIVYSDKVTIASLSVPVVLGSSPTPLTTQIGVVNIGTSVLATQATLLEINNKTPALGQQLASASQPVCLPTEQLIALSSVKASSNVFRATQLTIGNWYKIEVVDTETVKSTWTSMGALIGTVESIPPVGRIFKALNNGVGAGTMTTFSSIIYSENVKVSNFPALQPVSLSNPEIDPIPNTISIRQCKIGFWYKIEQIGTTPNQAWVDLGTEPIVGRVFRVNLDNQYILELTGTGEVSILPYFTGGYTNTGNSYYESTGVVAVDFQPMANTPFVSNTVGNTAQSVADSYTKLRSVILQKTDNILTYVYIYNKSAEEPPTDADTPVFRFIVKDTPIQLQFNQMFYDTIWIRATTDLNGTTDPDPNTLFVNITYG